MKNEFLLIEINNSRYVARLINTSLFITVNGFPFYPYPINFKGKDFNERNIRKLISNAFLLK
jgi:hypothetical protein